MILFFGRTFETCFRNIDEIVVKYRAGNKKILFADFSHRNLNSYGVIWFFEILEKLNFELTYFAIAHWIYFVLSTWD